MPETSRTAMGTATSDSLVAGLRDPANRTVWTAYVDRYRPILVRCATRYGLSRDDADDVAQQSLMAFATTLREGRYDRARGRLRSWLFGILKNVLREGRPRAAPLELSLGRPTESGDDLRDAPSAPPELEELWDREWQAAVLGHCLREVRAVVTPRTWEAFRLFALEERSAEDVADLLDMTPNAVFGAKRRVLDRIRALRPTIEEIF